MVSDVVVIEGMERPIIYALNRGGVWTIGDDYSFSQFGSEFPANVFHDHFVRDPVTGSVVGTNTRRGVFVIRPGEVAFTRLYKPDGAPLRSPGQATYVGRLEGTVIYDPSGLYLLDHQFRLQKLPFDGNPTKGVQSLIDLPVIKALLIASGNSVFLRDDTGHTVLLATLTNSDNVNHAVVTASGRIRIRANWSEFEIDPPDRDGSGRFRPVEGADSVRPDGPVSSSPVRSLSESTIGGRTYLFSDKELVEKTLYTQRRIVMPFANEARIETIIAFPRAQKIVVFAHAGIFALDVAGNWTEVPGSRDRIGYGTKIVDLKTDKGTLVAAKDALYLLVSSGNAVAKSCLK
jgi:hypothetical protein